MNIENENQYQLLLRQFPLKIEAVERVCYSHISSFDDRSIYSSLDAFSSNGTLQ